MGWRVAFDEKVPFEGGCVVAIGNFDGVHLGHRAVLAAAREEADRLGVPCVALTFEPHPRTVLFPQVPLHRLTEVDEKVHLLGEAGADGVAIVAFDLGVAGWSAQHFMDEVLVGWLGAKGVCVGENFRFGHRAVGDVALLRADGRFTVRALELLRDEGGVISSRRLRGEG